MDKFEYDFGYLKLSNEQLNKKLNSYGSKGWEVQKLEKIKITNELDSEGNSMYIWEIFMKRKNLKLNNHVNYN